MLRNVTDANTKIQPGGPQKSNSLLYQIFFSKQSFKPQKPHLINTAVTKMYILILH